MAKPHLHILLTHNNHILQLVKHHLHILQLHNNLILRMAKPLISRMVRLLSVLIREVHSLIKYRTQQRTLRMVKALLLDKEEILLLDKEEILLLVTLDHLLLVTLDHLSHTTIETLSHTHLVAVVVVSSLEHKFGWQTTHTQT